jgi:hypothetical protein
MKQESSSLIVPFGRAPLGRLEQACRLLGEVRRVDEVKTIRDQAEAARVYAREARLGLEAQNDAAEIRLRGERRAGELLALMTKHPGGRPTTAAENRFPPVGGFGSPSLADLQITERQSSQWQQIAAIPAPIFEEHIASTRSHRQELTTASALKLARSYRPPYVPRPVPVPAHDALDSSARFDVADAAALPWPDGSVDLVVTSPPYGLEQTYGAGDDVGDYQAWLAAMETWLRELHRVARAGWGRLCLNVPLDRDLGGWEPVSADVVQSARSVGWQFRTWLIWDKDQAGAGTGDICKSCGSVRW